jgi:glutaminyl-peptide cyclotransferase
MSSITAQARPGARYTVTFGEPAIVANCPRPVPLRFEVIRKITRSEVGFTQGLLWHDGKLLESTGAIGGRSGINIIAPDGTVTNLVDHGARVFGEGLTVLNDEMFQLTWQDREVLVYDLSGRLKRTMKNPRDGWGLTHDGASLIFSDGGPAFFVADPKTFAVQRAVKVLSDKAGDVHGLNELQYVDGKIYGNIYRSNAIVRIDPFSGLIEAWADMGTLWQSMTDADKAQVAADPNNVLNGVAYDQATGLFYVTGKRWPSIFVGRFCQ